MSKEPEVKKHLVCGIYTRKSTSEGLDQDFTSLDNQRESSENYIKSQQHEGWSVCDEKYDDGGFTGANVERPALQKLLAHIKEGRINCVVVYKVDRLSRSLLDFSQLLEFFDKNNVVFVSVTQQFNTNTSMGRLTLNILLSFAQFEREIISERTKDKMSAARKRGQWLGGRTPYGFVKKEKGAKLTADPDEAAIVKKIFDLYLNGHTSLEITKIMNEAEVTTRQWTTKTGKLCGKGKFSSNRVLYILKNYAYIGKVDSNGQIYAGQQEALIDEATFIKAQRRLEQNTVDRKPVVNTESTGLLTQILRCKACGTAMIHTYTIKKHKKKYRYYVCSNAQKRGYDKCPNRSIPAQLIEDAVVDRLREFMANKTEPMTCVQEEIEALLSPIWDALFPVEKRRIIKTILKEVDCNVATKRIGFTFHDSKDRLEFNAGIRRSKLRIGWRKDVAIKEEPKLKQTLILAYQLRRLLNDGTINGIPQAEKLLNLSETRIKHILNMLTLSPTIQDEIINASTEMLEAIPEYKVRDLSYEIDWNKQAELWRDAKNSAPDHQSLSLLTY